MSEAWDSCDLERLKNLVKHGQFKLTLVITDDLAVYKYTNENIDQLFRMGSFGFSFNPDNSKVLYWIKNNDGSYSYKEVQNEELFAPYPHHELLGIKENKSLKEAIK